MTVHTHYGLLPWQWLACRFPERPYQPGDTAFCAEPCRACLVVAEVQLNLVDPLTRPDLCDDWAQIINHLVAAP